MEPGLSHLRGVDMTNITNELANLQPVELDAGVVFSGNPSGTMIQGYSQPSAYTPLLDPDYIFHEASRDLIVWFLNPTEPVYIFGPTGCGKTSCIKQLAARLNYPVFEVTGHGRLEFSDMTGHHTVRNGNMTFEYGPLSLAMRYGGLFLLNEIDLTSPDVSAGLNGILDGSPLCIAENGGELITPHPLFRFAATANTNGGGDDTGLYQGTQRQNLAFSDRFILCEMGYPDAEVEEKLLKSRFPALPDKLRKTMVGFANEVRKLFMGTNSTSDMIGCIEVTFSTRSLLRWADLTMRFQPLAKGGIQPVTHALDRALAYRASRESRAMLHELAQRMFPQMEQRKPKDEGNCETEVYRYTGRDGIQYLNRMLASGAEPKTVVVLRKNVSDHDGIHTKDWIGEVHTGGFAIKFGKTGSVNQNRFYKLEDCLNNDPRAELQRRASRKLAEGYAIVPSLSSF